MYIVSKTAQQSENVSGRSVMFLLVIALGATGSIIFNQVQLTELTEEIDTAAQQLEESQSVYTQLQMKANANLSLATVESYAKEKFRHEEK